MYYWAQWILTEFTIAFPLTGVPVSSRVSTKIQQLLSTLKRPKRPPLKEFFVDDSEEIVEGSSESARSTHSLAASTRWVDVVKAERGMVLTQGVHVAVLFPSGSFMC